MRFSLRGIAVAFSSNTPWSRPLHAEQLSLIIRVKVILGSAAAKKIDFWLGTIHVDHSGLHAVGESMLPRWQGKRGVGVATAKMPAGAGATYNIVKNVINFPPGFDFKKPDNRAMVVHEAVHAMHDTLGAAYPISTRGGKWETKSSENEAAGYVAAALFSIYYSNPSAGQWTCPMWQEAYKLAIRVKDQPGAFIDRSLSADLRRVILKSPLYKSIKNDPMTQSFG